MTEAEAIEILSRPFDMKNVPQDILEAHKMAISALEKQEGKKPKIVGETEYSFFVDCPTCERRLINNLDGEWIAGEKSNYCPCCGQRIDWSDEYATD